MPKSDFFLVGPVTLSYVDALFEAKAGPSGGKPKFSSAIIFDDAVKAQIEAQIDAVGRAAFPQEWDVPNRCKKAVRVLAEKPAYADQIAKMPGATHFCSISSMFAPQVVGADKQPLLNILDPVTQKKPIYGGVKAYVYVNCYAYRHPQGGPGVSLGVSAVMKYMDGEPLIEQGSVDVQSAFASIPAGAPVAPVAPVAAVAPAQPIGGPGAVAGFDPQTGQPIPPVVGNPVPTF